MAATRENPIIFYDLVAADGGSWSPNPYKTRLTLNYKGLPYRIEYIAFPDIEPKLKELGVAPVSDAHPRYTLPAIADPSNDPNEKPTYVSDSFKIALYLDEKYPAPKYPAIFAPGTRSLQHLLVTHYYPTISMNIAPIILSRTLQILDARSVEYMCRHWGDRRKPLPEDVAAQKWAQAREGFAALGNSVELNDGTEDVGPFIAGKTVSFVDFAFGGLFYWIKKVEGGQGGAWQRFERGELELYPFYSLFGDELSDTELGNRYYREWCQSKNIDTPALPVSVKIDGRELFGRMMRSHELDPYILSAIHKLRESKQFRIVALTNNYSAQYERIRDTPPSKQGAHIFSPEAELEFLGWGKSTGGPAGPKIRGLFDDFVDSSVVGSRKPEPGIYLYACKANSVSPNEVVFLDDLGLNLKTAQQLGMRTIHVPIGGSRKAVEQLQQLLGMQLLDSENTYIQSQSGGKSKL